jgi:hypothetical protein
VSLSQKKKKKNHQNPGKNDDSHINQQKAWTKVEV